MKIVISKLTSWNSLDTSNFISRIYVFCFIIALSWNLQDFGFFCSQSQSVKFQTCEHWEFWWYLAELFQRLTFGSRSWNFMTVALPECLGSQVRLCSVWMTLLWVWIFNWNFPLVCLDFCLAWRILLHTLTGDCYCFSSFSNSSRVSRKNGF